MRGQRNVSDGITIALDAMGGDGAPAIVLKGAEIALQRHPGVRYLAVRRRRAGPPACSRSCRGLAKRRRCVHTSEVVAADAKPSLGAPRRAAIEHAACYRCGSRRARGRRRVGRKHRRTDGDGEIRTQDVAGDRSSCNRFLLPDPARRERNARPRRQHRSAMPRIWCNSP